MFLKGTEVFVNGAGGEIQLRGDVRHARSVHFFKQINNLESRLGRFDRMFCFVDHGYRFDTVPYKVSSLENSEREQTNHAAWLMTPHDFKIIHRATEELTDIDNTDLGGFSGSADSTGGYAVPDETGVCRHPHR
ncbi:hypothetical protein [Natrinema sp. 74]|uniref:hypothetical protein n=1 Tax=Natrinema sp. 74 TaxID=3384159 RepID=UPI0038D4345C